ncbi:hypothetical protein BZJ20_16010 [Salinivibrio proteolyticus]|nr:hypothetical protein BZJ20_16010 [Salinivibrio proteolyticus]
MAFSYRKIVTGDVIFLFKISILYPKFNMQNFVSLMPLLKINNYSIDIFKIWFTINYFIIKTLIYSLKRTTSQYK